MTLSKEAMRSVPGKDPLAVELGRRGGIKGAAALYAKLTPEERSAKARYAALVRHGRSAELLPMARMNHSTVRAAERRGTALVVCVVCNQRVYTDVRPGGQHRGMRYVVSHYGRDASHAYAGFPDGYCRGGNENIA